MSLLEPSLGERTVEEAYAAGWSMPPARTVDVWADAERILTSDRSHFHGKYRTATTPYMREIMIELSSSSPFERVIFMKCPQCGATEGACNCIGAWQVDDPSTVIYAAPSLDDVRKFIRSAVDPMIQNSPSVNAVFSEARGRSRSNSTLLKESIGGRLIGVGMSSPKGLAGSPARRAIADDVDRAPAEVDQEGDPLGLLWYRLLTFENRKLYVVSTPGKSEDESRIYKLFREGDQRYYYLPCPHCGERHVLTWNGFLKYHDQEGGGQFQMVFDREEPDVEKKIASIHALCPDCRGQIKESSKPAMLAKGEWRPTAKGDGKTASFHLSGLYSPFDGLSWERILRTFLEAKEDPSALRQWLNLNLAECWREQPDSVKVNVLIKRREDYPAEVPNGVGVLVGAADVQSYGLVTGVLGYAVREESWWIDYRIIEGGLGLDSNVWKEFDALRARTWLHESGRRLRTERWVIDLGGSNPDEVKAYCKSRAHQSVYAIRGGNDATADLVGKFSRKNDARIRIYTLGVSSGKDTLHGRLKIPSPGPGFIHIPKSIAGEEIHWSGVEFAAGLTSEVKKKIRIPGRGTTHIWDRIYPQNEPWDLMNYALACVRHMGSAVARNLKARAESFAAPLTAEELAAAVKSVTIPTTAPTQAPPPMRRPPFRRGGYVRRGRF
jgi:phage terminase large subunit GpA-like protein